MEIYGVEFVVDCYLKIIIKNHDFSIAVFGVVNTVKSVSEKKLFFCENLNVEQDDGRILFQ